MLLQNYLEIVNFFEKFFCYTFIYMNVPFPGKFFVYTIFHSLEIFISIDFLKSFLLMRIVNDVINQKKNYIFKIHEKSFEILKFGTLEHLEKEKFLFF